MEAVKIILYQNMVNYRKEMSYGYVQTYPLPTPSMVRGMVHALLNLKEYHNLSISIQGNYESVVTNMQKIYKFDKNRKERPDNPYDITIVKSSKTATHGVMFVDEIVDMDLVLHICFDDAELNRELLKAVKSKTVVLGRNEDIAQVDFENTKIVHLSEVDEDENYTLRNNIFIPQQTAKDAMIYSTAYHLPFYYFPVTSFEDKRIFKFVDAVYVAKGEEIKEIEYLVDDDNDIVFFLKVKADE